MVHLIKSCGHLFPFMLLLEAQESRCHHAGLPCRHCSCPGLSLACLPCLSSGVSALLQRLLQQACPEGPGQVPSLGSRSSPLPSFKTLRAEEVWGE